MANFFFRGFSISMDVSAVKNNVYITKMKKVSRPMIVGLLTDSPFCGEHLNEFLNCANNNLQGPSIVAFYTALNNVKQSYLYDSNCSNRAQKLNDILREEVRTNPSIQDNANTWLKYIKENYSKSFNKRIFLAEKDSVRFDKVKPQPLYKRINRKLKLLLKKIPKIDFKADKI